MAGLVQGSDRRDAVDHWRRKFHIHGFASVTIVLGNSRHFNELPRISIFENLFRKRRVQRVATPMGDKVSNHGVTHQSKITHNIQDLVANELILETQGIVQDTSVSKHNGVIK